MESESESETETENPHRHLSSSTPVPYSPRHLAVVPSTAPRLSIPPGWGVEEVPRRDGSRSDLYYYEPVTGKKFRSRREISRYLRGEYLCPRPRRSSSRINSLLLFQNPGSRRMIVSGGKLLELDGNCNINDAPTAPDFLRDGWIVEDDKYYYEPGTGQRFQSLAGVERYLAEMDEENAPLSKALEEIKESKPLSKLFKLESHTKNSIPRSKNVYGETKQASLILGPPSKVSWVIASPQGDEWNPFVSDSLVPNSVKQQWGNRFMLLMNNESQNFQSS